MTLQELDAIYRAAQAKYMMSSPSAANSINEVNARLAGIAAVIDAMRPVIASAYATGQLKGASSSMSSMVGQEPSAYAASIIAAIKKDTP